MNVDVTQRCNRCGKVLLRDRDYVGHPRYGGYCHDCIPIPSPMLGVKVESGGGAVMASEPVKSGGRAQPPTKRDRRGKE